MTANERINGYLGLAARGRKIESGEFSVEKAVKAGRAMLVIIAADASDNTKKKFHSLCEYHGVPCFEFLTREGLGHAIGREFRATCAVTDRNLSDAVIRIIEQECSKGR